MIYLKLRGCITIAFLLFLHSISFADNLPGFVEKTNIYSFSEDLNKIIYRNYEEGTVYRTDLQRNSGGTIEHAVYQLSVGSEWENISRHSYFYDVQGVQTSDIYYTFSDNDWHPVSKENYLFDNNGNLCLKESYQYLSGSDSWMGTGEKIERLFDAMNRCTKYTVSGWKNGNWKPLSEGTITYLNNLPSVAVYRTESGGGSLENSSQIFYTYTGNNLSDFELYQSWNGVAWIDAIKINYTNAGGLITSKTIEYINNSGVFEYLTRYEYEYANNALSKIIIKSEPAEFGIWGKADTVNLTYSGNNVSVEELGESDSNKWVYKYEPGTSEKYFLYNEKEGILSGIAGYQYSFTNNYLPLELIKYNRLEESNNWQQAQSASWIIEDKTVTLKQKETISGTSVLKRQIEFLFGDGLVTVKKYPSTGKFEIFPNPVKEGFVIQLSEMSKMTDYFIYSTTGRLVTRGKISELQHYVDASKLSSGQYIITVVSEAGKSSSVFLKL